MSRRLLLFPFLGAVLVGLALGVLLLWPRPSTIIRENAAKIQVGMTPGEVEAILGGPPRDDGVGLIVYQRPDGTKGTASQSELSDSLDLPDEKHWLSDEIHVEITLDDAGRVADVTVEAVQRASEGPIDRLRHWLGL
jgi:hypothetical protein